ncbi:MAG: hypothetical protein VKL39_11175 [Leptolyngbyaceae bacterium]|nr:hypothetical protein [Leptolyngbyaceae bacterium]
MIATDLFAPLKQLSRSDKLKVMQFLITELANEEESAVSQSEESRLSANHTTPSALDLAGDLVGCLDSGLGDLSTNPSYMEGFGT